MSFNEKTLGYFDQEKDKTKGIIKEQGAEKFMKKQTKIIWILSGIIALLLVCMGFIIPVKEAIVPVLFLPVALSVMVLIILHEYMRKKIYSYKLELEIEELQSKIGIK